MLCLLATAIHPLPRDDILDELTDYQTSDKPETWQRVFYTDLNWLCDQLGADIGFFRHSGGYALLSIPPMLAEALAALADWRQRT